MKKMQLQLTDEQQELLNQVKQGHNVLVDACIGSGKTTAIQELCNMLPDHLNILYLTYNRLLKVDAKHKIKNSNVTVTNYHGFASMMLLRVGVVAAPAELIQVFLREKPPVPKYDIVVFDEYQDIDQEISDLLLYIEAANPNIQKVAVGDMDQKIYDKTTLDAKAFISAYLGEHVRLKFTKCFRLSEDIASMLGRVWKKDIVGVNDTCSVEYMTFKEVVLFLMEQKPKDILCVGTRTGDMAKALNKLEDLMPDTFNKRTVFASIRNQDAMVEPKKTNAIFTTYDSCKGMERRFCVVFDFDESNWQMRLDQPQQSYEILRNIFCVAASRGKEKIIFVKPFKEGGKALPEDFLSEETLLTNPGRNMSFTDVNISEMFDFKYKEDIEACYNLLDIEEFPMDDDEIINVQDNDALIDLSPCIGTYQEAMFFDGYNIDREIELTSSLKPDLHIDTEGLSVEEKVLVLTALATAQDRYRKQVDVPFISDENKAKICNRLSSMFNHDEHVQIKCSIPFHDADGRLLFHALGILDVLKQNVVFELKFTNELTHVNFLQCASYMLAMNLSRGMLWNVKKNKCYRIRIKDREAFEEQVALTITKHAITIAHQTDEIKKKVSLNAGLLGYIPQTFEKQKRNTTVIQKNESDKKAINKIAVLDIETNFDDDIVSLGIVIGDAKTYKPLTAKYYILHPAVNVWGMYNDFLYIKHDFKTQEDTRDKVIADLVKILAEYDVRDIFAYNSNIDYRHLPELQDFNWYDIMKIAAYRQHNPHLSPKLEYCNTGRLRTNYGVEAMMNMLMASRSYYEKHHALYDALDELKLMQLLGLPIDTYNIAKIN